MNILFTSSDAGNTGATYSLANLVDEMNKIGNNTLVVLPKHGKAEQIFDALNINYIIIPSISWVDNLSENIVRKLIKKSVYLLVNPIAVARIRKIIIKQRINIVHVNSICSCVGGQAAIKENCKLVWHIREFLEEDLNKKFWNKKNSLKLIAKSNSIIAISKAVQRKYNELIQKKINVIYNGVDINKYMIEQKTLFNYKITKFVIYGRISESKGHMELIKALGVLNKSYLNWELSIYGEATNLKFLLDLKQAVKDMGISDKIYFYEHVENVKDILLDKDVSFVCSDAEAFGRVTVESMLAKTIVVGANTGGTVELINDGVTGFLYKKGDCQNLYEVITKVLERKYDVTLMTENAQNHVINIFTKEENAKKIFDVYKEILK